jgi:hypothetical protein
MCRPPASPRRGRAPWLAARVGDGIEIEGAVEIELGRAVELVKLGHVDADVGRVANHHAGRGVLIEVVGMARRSNRDPATRVIDQEVVPRVAGLVGVLDTVVVVIGVRLDVVLLEHALDGGKDPVAEVIRSRDVGRRKGARRRVVRGFDGQQSEEGRRTDQEDDDDDRTRSVRQDVRPATRSEQPNQPIRAIGHGSGTRNEPVEQADLPLRGAA